MKTCDFCGFVVPNPCQYFTESERCGHPNNGRPMQAPISKERYEEIVGQRKLQDFVVTPADLSKQIMGVEPNRVFNVLGIGGSLDGPGKVIPVDHPGQFVYAPNPPKPDAVDQPQHYARWKMQPIEFICINDIDFRRGAVIKYIMRHDAKNGLEDLYKARSFLDMIIREAEGHPRFWEKPVSEERKLNAKV